MVVTEMNTPIRALARAWVRDTTPAMPASTATTREYTSGVLINPRPAGCRPGTGQGPGRPPDGQPEQQGHRDGGQETPQQSEQAVPHRAAGSTADTERHGDDRVVLRAHHHRGHDQDLRVRDESHRADQPSHGQQDVKAWSTGLPAADDGLHHLPYRRGLAPQCAAVRGHRRLASERRVHPLHADHPVAIKAEVTQRPQHRIGRLVAHIELDRVAVRPASSPACTTTFWTPAAVASVPASCPVTIAGLTTRTWSMTRLLSGWQGLCVPPIPFGQPAGVPGRARHPPGPKSRLLSAGPPSRWGPNGRSLVAPRRGCLPGAARAVAAWPEVAPTVAVSGFLRAPW